MRESFVKLHIAVLLAGFTGIFGKLVTLNELPLTWYRIVLAALMLIGFLAFERKLRRVSFKDFLKIGGVGVLLGLHWTMFYGSIKAANISIGVVCFSLTGFFTALFEPLFSHKRISVKELLFSLLTLTGIALIFHFSTQYRLGIIIGCTSAAIAALFTIGSKGIGRSMPYPASTLLMYEMIGGAIGLSLLLPLFAWHDGGLRIMPTLSDFLWLLLLSSACTIVLYVLQIQVLKKVSAFTVSLTFNLEPIYSIIIAMFFFGEAKEMNASFFVGLGLILLSVALQTVSVLIEKRKEEKKIVHSMNNEQ